MISLMAAAAATTRLRVASHVLANDFHHPVLLAQSATTLNMLSDGRFEFGLGAGWLRADYDACGLPFDAPSVRLARLEHAVRVIKALWHGDAVQVTGDEDRTTGHEPSPRRHPPMFLGGEGRRMLTLAAREADIVGLGGDFRRATPEALDERMQWVREAAGPRFEELEIHLGIDGFAVTRDRGAAAADIAAFFTSVSKELKVQAPPLTPEHVLTSPRFLVGTLDDVVDDVLALRERYGVSYVTVHGDQAEAFSPIVARLAGR